MGLLCASPLGVILYVVSAITVIGIPIAILVMAVPTISVFVVGAFLIWRFTPLDGVIGAAVAFVFAAALMVIVPFAHNAEMGARVSLLKRADQPTPDAATLAQINRGDVFGIARPHGSRAICRALCAHLLITGQATAVIMGSVPKGRNDPDFETKAYMFVLQKVDECKHRNVRLHSQHSHDRTPTTIAGRYARLRDGGYCIVTHEASLAKAETVVMSLDRLDFTPPWTFSPMASLIRAERAAVYTKAASSRTGLARAWQVTRVNWSQLASPLSFIFQGTHGLNVEGRWRRSYIVDPTGVPDQLGIIRALGFDLPDKLI
ncbi:MAG: hypothetical protein AAFR13_00090 [Pseudomonadota bacterium]